jgi:hypothetical protein
MAKSKLATPLETPVVEEDNSLEKVEQVQKVHIGVDKSVPVVLSLNQDKGMDLVWDANDFKKLPMNAVEQLRLDNLRRYITAEVQYDAAVKARAAQPKILRNPLNPMASYASKREFIRARTGWHQCWAAPGRDFEAKVSGPYKQIRKPTAEQEKVGFKPGEEEGEILKRYDSEGKVEAIAVELPQQVYEDWLEYCSAASGVKKQEVRASFMNEIEDINRTIRSPGQRLQATYDPTDND